MVCVDGFNLNSWPTQRECAEANLETAPAARQAPSGGRGFSTVVTFS